MSFQFELILEIIISLYHYFKVADIYFHSRDYRCRRADNFFQLVGVYVCNTSKTENSLEV